MQISQALRAHAPRSRRPSEAWRILFATPRRLALVAVIACRAFFHQAKSTPAAFFELFVCTHDLGSAPRDKESEPHLACREAKKYLNLVRLGDLQ